METITLTSDYAQHHWHETIDAACTSQQDVVIEQQGKPVVTPVNYEAFQRMKRELLILQGQKRAESHLKCDKPASVEPCHAIRVTYDSRLFLVNPMNFRRAFILCPNLFPLPAFCRAVDRQRGA